MLALSSSLRTPMLPSVATGFFAEAATACSAGPGSPPPVADASGSPHPKAPHETVPPDRVAPRSDLSRASGLGRGGPALHGPHRERQGGERAVAQARLRLVGGDRRPGAPQDPRFRAGLPASSGNEPASAPLRRTPHP